MLWQLGILRSWLIVLHNNNTACVFQSYHLNIPQITRFTDAGIKEWNTQILLFKWNLKGPGKTSYDIYSTTFRYLENRKFPHRGNIYRFMMTTIICP